MREMEFLFNFASMRPLFMIPGQYRKSLRSDRDVHNLVDPESALRSTRPGARPGSKISGGGPTTGGIKSFASQMARSEQ